MRETERDRERGREKEMDRERKRGREKGKQYIYRQIESEIDIFTLATLMHYYYDIILFLTIVIPIKAFLSFR